MNHKTSYRILKLVNGDNIIGEITESSAKKLALYRPFQMKVFTIAADDTDEDSIFHTEILMMRNWLSMTNEINSIIARNHVISISIPKESIINCYEEEKKKEDDPNYFENKQISNDLEDAGDNEEYEITVDPEFIEKILGDILKSKESILPFMEEDYIDNNEDYNLKEVDDQDTDKDMFGY